MSEPKRRPSNKNFFSTRWFGILAALLLFGFAILVQLPVLSERFPGLDDSGYLFDGVRLIERGTLMPLGSGPLAGILNGLIYFFFPRDHMLLGTVSMIRRVLLLVGITTAAGLAGHAVGGRWAAWGAMALTAVARPVTTALMVTGDSLYSALAGLAFALLTAGWIAEKRNGTKPAVARWIGIGLLLGFSALTRLDGLLLGLTLIPMIWFFRGRNRASARDAAVFGGTFLLPVAAYLLIYGIATGSWDPQIGQRSYLAFEQGHNFLYTDRYEVVPSPSSAELYGTPEENGYSVLRAIARNPGAFLTRLPLTAANAVRMFFDAYSILGGAMFLFLAVGGSLALWIDDRRAVAGFTLLWCLPLAGYALASYRPGFFGMLFPVLLACVAAGASLAFSQMRLPWKSEQAPLLGVWVLVALGMLGAQLAFAAGQFRGWGAERAADDRFQSWLAELSAQVPRGECIISYDTAAAVYSNHEVYGYWRLFYEAADAEALRGAMRAAGCRYLVVDDALRSLAPDFVPIAEGALVPIYTSADGTRTIYELKP